MRPVHCSPFTVHAVKGMAYTVKEIFYTLQGEGAQTGRPAVFCRFAGCNLWSGRESDRETAVCNFCDTDFVGTDGPGGGRFGTAKELVAAVAAAWPAANVRSRFVVCTGGEPLLQVDEPLIHALHAEGFEIAVETNGTQPAPEGLDWICMSPKAGTEIQLQSGDELKLIYPQGGRSRRASSISPFATSFSNQWTGRTAILIPRLHSSTASIIRAGG